MKKVIEILLCILHPVAVVLIWINLLGRSDIGFLGKLAWGIAAIVPFVPFLYVLASNPSRRATARAFAGARQRPWDGPPWAAYPSVIYPTRAASKQAVLRRAGPSLGKTGLSRLRRGISCRWSPRVGDQYVRFATMPPSRIPNLLFADTVVAHAARHRPPPRRPPKTSRPMAPL
jgi:hypothetical protein